MNESPRSSEEMVLYAWVGANDDVHPALGGSPDAVRGEYGLKQAICPAGTIPMVACKEEKMNQDYIIAQMEYWATKTGIKRQLVRFKFDKIIKEVKP